MQFLKILCASFLLLTAPTMAQNRHFWDISTGATGDAVVAWPNDYEKNLYVSIYHLGVWSTPASIPGSVDTYPWPILTEMIADGSIILIWGNPDDGTILSSVKLPNQDWTTAAVISHDQDFSLAPLLSLDPAGNATLIWYDFVEGLQATRLLVGTTTWSEPETISD